MRRRWLRLAAGVAVAVLSMSGCGVTRGLYGVPLPGGEGAFGPIYHVTVVFDNVMDLVPQSSVKVGDVSVGSVEKISLTPDFKAKVLCRIKKSVKLPANAIAILQQTSLLGEKFIELAPPTGQAPQGTLADGATIGDGSATAYPDVEEVFGALSAVLNGGSLERLQTISVELSKALGGREQQVRDFLKQLNTLVSGLDAQKQAIVRAIDGLDRLSGELASQTGTITVALRDLGPGLKVLADQKDQLTRMLTGLSRLGQISTKVINASKDNTVADLNALKPVLGELAAAGQSLPRSLDLLLDYPFPNSATKGMLGDYANLYATVDVSSICNVAPVPGFCSSTGAAGPAGAAGTPGSGPTSPGLPSVRVPAPSIRPVPAPTPTIGGLGALLGSGAG